MLHLLALGAFVSVPLRHTFALWDKNEDDTWAGTNRYEAAIVKYSLMSMYCCCAMTSIHHRHTNNCAKNPRLPDSTIGIIYGFSLTIHLQTTFFFLHFYHFHFISHPEDFLAIILWFPPLRVRRDSGNTLEI